MPRTHRDPVRLLGRTGSYTDRFAYALRSGAVLEPEAVDAATQARLSDRAATDRSNQRTLTRADLAKSPPAVRLARCKAQAKATKVDAHRELRMVRLAIDGGRSAEHIARRLACLERRLWPNLPAA
ncbi:MAG TPA: hypothetical protein VNS09_02345 [Solirubrobacter sp.]|nr:hypothetical protein [Solirubrobacter sp.]